MSRNVQHGIISLDIWLCACIIRAGSADQAAAAALKRRINKARVLADTLAVLVQETKATTVHQILLKNLAIALQSELSREETTKKAADEVNQEAAKNV